MGLIISEVEAVAAACHYPQSGLRDVTEIVVGVVGEVVCAHPQLVARPHELQLEVEHGVWLILNDFARWLCVDILQIAAQAVLPTQVPRCRQRSEDAVRESGGELVTQIVECIVALENLLVVVARLVDVGVAQRQRLQHVLIAEDVGKIDVGSDFGAKVVEAEVRGMIFVVC